MMKISIFAVAAFALLGVVDVHAEKSCMRGSESCNKLKNDAKKVFKAILSGPKEDHETEILNLLEQVQDLFSAMGRVDCRIEACTCSEAGTLQCGLFAEKLRSRADDAPLPDCIRNSVPGTFVYNRFKASILASDNPGIADAIKLVRDNLNSGLYPKDEMFSCLKTSVQALRKFLKQTAKSSDMQKNCDFCQAR